MWGWVGVAVWCWGGTQGRVGWARAPPSYAPVLAWPGQCSRGLCEALSPFSCRGGEWLPQGPQLAQRWNRAVCFPLHQENPAGPDQLTPARHEWVTQRQSHLKLGGQGTSPKVK